MGASRARRRVVVITVVLGSVVAILDSTIPKTPAQDRPRPGARRCVHLGGPTSGTSCCCADSAPRPRYSFRLQSFRARPQHCFHRRAWPPAAVLPLGRADARDKHLDSNIEHRRRLRSAGRQVARRLRLAQSVLGQPPVMPHGHHGGAPVARRLAQALTIRTRTGGNDLAARGVACRADSARNTRSRARSADASN